jgi:hypothetical protein
MADTQFENVQSIGDEGLGRTHKAAAEFADWSDGGAGASFKSMQDFALNGTNRALGSFPDAQSLLRDLSAPSESSARTDPPDSTARIVVRRSLNAVDKAEGLPVGVTKEDFIDKRVSRLIEAMKSDPNDEFAKIVREADRAGGKDLVADVLKKVNGKLATMKEYAGTSFKAEFRLNDPGRSNFYRLEYRYPVPKE